MNKKELLNIIADLKQTIEDQALITRRTIVKNAQKGDYLTLRSKWLKYEERMKHEQYMRRKYPAVNNAYKQYKILIKMVGTEKKVKHNG